MGIEVYKKASQLAVQEYIKNHGKNGKLTLRIKAKENWRGRVRLDFYVVAGETVIAKLNSMYIEDELNIVGLGLEFLEWD